MSDKEPENKNGLFELLNRLWMPVAGFLGTISLIYSFYKTWLGDQTTFTYFIAGGGLVVLVITLSWAGFGMRTIHTPASWAVGHTIMYRESVLKKRSQQIAARVVLGIVLTGAITWLSLAGIKNYQENQLKATKFVILVADFVGPDPLNYQVTDELIQQLRASMSEFEDTAVVALGKDVKEADGSEYARNAGAKIQADVVLWGRYSVSGEDVILNIHVENLTVSTELPSTTSYESIKVNGLEQFEFREMLSREMSAFTLFMAGLSRYEAEEYENAYPYFAAALDQDAWPEDLGNRAAIYYFRGNTAFLLSVDGKDDSNIRKYQDQAESDFTTLIQLMPDDPNGYFYRSQVYKAKALNTSDGNKSLSPESENYYQQAINDISHTIELDPEFSGARLVRATTYLIRGELDLALADYQAMPEDWYSLYWQGMIHSMQGKNELALGDYTKAIELNPSWTFYYDPYYRRGQIYIEMGKYKEAIQDFETSHKLGEPEYLYNRNYADVYKAQKNYDKALKYYTLAVQEDPDQPSSFLRDRGQIYYELKLYKEAIKDLTSYIEDENLSDYYAYYYRGLSYQATGEKTLADADFLMAAPDMLNQGFKNIYRDRYDSALKVFSEILLVDENNVKALIGRARALTGLEKYTEALPDINRAIELDSTNSEAYGVRSVIYANLSNMDGAIDDWKSILLYSDSQDEIDWANEALKNAGVAP